MSHNKDISIVIPVANMSGKLQSLHELVKKALFNQIQVILVHDFHDEGTSKELKEIFIDLKDLGDLTLIEGEYGSPGQARNAGKKLCTRGYIAFWDSDDFANIANFIEFFNYTVLNESDIAIAEFVIRNGETTSEIKDLGNNFEETYRSIALNPGIWRFIFKNSLISDLLFPSFRMGEDQVFIANALVYARKISLFKKPVYEYHMSHQGQLTKDPKNLVDIVRSLDRLSTIHLSTTELVKSQFISVMYWKMYLTLITRKASAISIFAKVKILKNLAITNPKLFQLFCGQFIVKRNYTPLL